MSDRSGISWTDSTWNPVSGCTPISEGCANCYAKAMAKRLQARGVKGYERGFEPTAHPDKVQLPKRWRKPRRVFVVSMGDLFHEMVPDYAIRGIWSVMIAAAHHTYFVLTKRPERMRDFILRQKGDLYRHWGHIWLGVTAENQARADERIPILLDTPAVHRFVSVEPMLGPVDLAPWTTTPRRMATEINRSIDYHLAMGGSEPDDDYGPAPPDPMLDYVICGGESGPSHRNMNPDWARAVRDQCQAANVPFHFKQHSGPRPGWKPELDGVLHRATPPFGVTP